MDNFIKIFKISDFENLNINTAVIGDRNITVYKYKGKYFASDNICTHAYCELSKGILFDNTIECPCHGSKFDIRTGKVLSLPAVKPVRVYKTRISGNYIEIDLDY